MTPDYRTPTSNRQAAQRLHQQLITVLGPLLRYLDDQVDARLVRTFVATITAILSCRHRAYGLLVNSAGIVWPPIMPRPGPSGSVICSARRNGHQP